MCTVVICPQRPICALAGDCGGNRCFKRERVFLTIFSSYLTSKISLREPLFLRFLMSVANAEQLQHTSSFCGYRCPQITSGWLQYFVSFITCQEQRRAVALTYSFGIRRRRQSSFSLLLLSSRDCLRKTSGHAFFRKREYRVQPGPP